MTAQRKDTQFSFRINAEFLEQVRQRCQQEGVSLAEVISAALQDFVDYGPTRPPPACQEEDGESFL